MISFIFRAAVHKRKTDVSKSAARTYLAPPERVKLITYEKDRDSEERETDRISKFFDSSVSAVLDWLV